MSTHLSPRRLLVGGFGCLLVVAAGFSLFHLRRAVSAGTRGRSALSQAESSLSARHIPESRQKLVAAKREFTRTSSEINALGPLGAVAKRTPLLGNQLRAAEVFASSGRALAEAGLQLVGSADTILNPGEQSVAVSDALDALRRTDDSLTPAVAVLQATSAKVASLRGAVLVGPLARARDDLAVRLPKLEVRAESAKEGLTALLAFGGGSGPKRYLFLSQNPDELRPTGGFIGSYGVLTAEAGKMEMQRYDGIEGWALDHPGAVVPTDKIGSPLRLFNPPLPQSLANVNNRPDWPETARLAIDLWRAGGEAPVDGVISFMPGFLSRILAVVGPVSVPSYGETVTAANVVERLDFQTHKLAPVAGTDRKDFLGVLAEAVMRRLFDAPSSQWEPLGKAIGQAFDAHQILVWSTDPQVQSTLSRRAWDGAFPQVQGDFFYNAEFAYASKSGRGIRRTVDHRVRLRPDGSARITSTITITNTDPPDPVNNPGGLGYITLYGPAGAVLDPLASDPFSRTEPALAGHPAAGWFRDAAASGGQTTLTVVWDAPAVARPLKDGSRMYDLRWLHLPDHMGDKVNLSVELPPGWRWEGAEPPAQFSLDQDFTGSWHLTAG